MNPIVIAEHVTRYYGMARGVSGFNLTVQPGTILGLLGENGCGKTTAMKLLTGMMRPDYGNILTLGADPAYMPPVTRARLGWLSDTLAVPKGMALQDAMDMQAAYFPTWDWAYALSLAKMFDLKPDVRYRQLSIGQQKRYMLVLVLAQKPDLLILDEPANGLDIAVRRQFIDLLLEEVSTRSLTVIISTHILSDLEKLIDTVAFMKAGQVRIHAELDDLRARVKRLVFSNTAEAQTAQGMFHVIQRDHHGNSVRLVIDDYEPARAQALSATVEHLNLEDLFVVYNTHNSAQERTVP